MSGDGTDFEIVRISPPRDVREQMWQEVREGLARSPKRLPSKYFYDGRGSELFVAITELPEYYLTRAETEILEEHAGDIIAAAQPEELTELAQRIRQGHRGAA